LGVSGWEETDRVRVRVEAMARSMVKLRVQLRVLDRA